MRCFKDPNDGQFALLNPIHSCALQYHNIIGKTNSYPITRVCIQFLVNPFFYYMVRDNLKQSIGCSSGRRPRAHCLLLLLVLELLLMRLLLLHKWLLLLLRLLLVKKWLLLVRLGSGCWHKVRGIVIDCIRRVGHWRHLREWIRQVGLLLLLHWLLNQAGLMKRYYDKIKLGQKGVNVTPIYLQLGAVVFVVVAIVDEDVVVKPKGLLNTLFCIVGCCCCCCCC